MSISEVHWLLKSTNMIPAAHIHYLSSVAHLMPFAYHDVVE